MKIAPLNQQRIGNVAGLHIGFMWALNPIIEWMRFVGIELNCSKERASWGRWFGPILLVFNVLLGVFSVIKKAFVGYDVRQVVGLLERANFAFYSAALHLAFVWCARCNWNHLYQILRKVELSFGSSYVGLYQMCRQVTIIGTVFFIVVRSYSRK